MRLAVLIACLCLPAAAQAGGVFVPLQTPNLQITKLTADGRYGVGSIAGNDGRIRGPVLRL